MIYKKEGDKIIFEIPFLSRRHNPYMEDDAYCGEYPTLTGLIVRHKKGGSDWDEVGFAHTIDMDYKGKPDQVGGFLVMWMGEEDAFRKQCNEWGLGIHEIEV